MTHDATSVIGILAGLDTEPAPRAITPDELAAAFCSNRDAGYIGAHDTAPSRGDGFTIRSGFCGYNGRRDSRDSLLTGFDDGYDFVGYLEPRGWAADAGIGDWPYVVALFCRADPLVMVQYCEADFSLIRFDDAAVRARYRKADAEMRD